METPKPSGSPDTKLHFLDYWRIIRIRKTVILAVFLLVVLTTTAVTFILPESFSSMVRIEVGKDNPDIAPILYGAQAQNTFDPYFIQTEFEKIKSKSVLNDVISELNLQEEWSKRYGAEGKLKTSEIYQILVKQVDVRQSRNTSLIEIRVFDENRQKAADIANKIVEVYKRVRLQTKMSASSNAVEVLKEKLLEQDQKVNSAQARVDVMRREMGGISDVGDGFASSTLEPETVRMLERERISAEAAAASYETLFKELQSKTPAQLVQAIPTAIPDTELTQLLRDLNTAESQYSKLVVESGPENASVKQISAIITTVRAQIQARVEGVLNGIAAQVAARSASARMLSNQVQTAKERDASQMEKYRPYFLAKKDLETQQRIRETLLLRIVQERIDAALPKTTVVTVTDAAEPSIRPVRPNIPLKKNERQKWREVKKGC